MANYCHQLVTVYLDAAGVPPEALGRLTRRLVAAKLAATGEVYQGRSADSGVRTRVRLHTRAQHLVAIRARAICADSVTAYPLECPDDYRDWVLSHTAEAKI